MKINFYHYNDENSADMNKVPYSIGTNTNVVNYNFNFSPSSYIGINNEQYVSNLKALNMFISDIDLPNGLLGFATPPSNGGSNTEFGSWYQVGSLNNFPNGTQFPYNIGGTVPHEVGHNLGLSHTFQQATDNCQDTIKQSASGITNQENELTRSVLEPAYCWSIKNYMSYSTDLTMSEITGDQYGIILTNMSNGLLEQFNQLDPQTKIDQNYKETLDSIKNKLNNENIVIKNGEYFDKHNGHHLFQKHSKCKCGTKHLVYDKLNYKTRAHLRSINDKELKMSKKLRKLYM